MINKIFNDLRNNYTSICKSKRMNISDKMLSNLPKKPGVYIFYENRHVIYVGRANNLYLRITQSHLSKSNRVASSPFRKKLFEKRGVHYKKLREYIIRRFEIKYVELPTYDDTILLEALLIRQWRGMKKHKLLNNCYKLED